MAQVGRLLRQCLTLQHHCCSCATLHQFLYSSSLPVTTKSNSYRLSSTTVQSATRGVQKLSRGLRPADQIDGSSGSGSGSDSDSVTYKSRNQLKRDARRAVRWAMDLASFSTPLIKRILRVASLDQVVLDAVKLVKRLGPDVREGKRRQYNYIGKLLRDVDPDLMDNLIRATKDSDENKLKELEAKFGSETLNIGDDEEEEEAEEEAEEEEEEEGSHIAVATRWVHGLINKDIEITNQVYSIPNVEFDRQELRKLVRRVHSSLEQKANLQENKGELDAAIVGAEKSLTRFLRALAKSSLMINVMF